MRFSVSQHTYIHTYIHTHTHLHTHTHTHQTQEGSRGVFAAVRLSLALCRSPTLNTPKSYPKTSEGILWFLRERGRKGRREE